MKFFFPDSQDLVDPSFDFEKETRSEQRLRHRDDLYAHEVFSEPAYDGVLVSKASVDGKAGDSGRYTLAQRHRLLRVGVRDFFRLNGRPLETMGDCGAFSYVKEEYPPVTVDEVLDFYAECGFDYGVSIDHVILAYQPELDKMLPGVDFIPDELRRRQEITQELAAEFLRQHDKRRCRFTPVGVAQGWSPNSYAEAVKALQKMGYEYIGLGGMVPLKTEEIMACLEGANDVRRPKTRFHLFGVTRPDHIGGFQKYGVVSFDSTSPLRQAFKHDRENYFTLDGTYSAIRIPQVEGNASVQKRIVAGEIDQGEARRLEQACLRDLRGYDKGSCPLNEVLAPLREYDCLFDGRKDRTEDYREVLVDRPWKHCPCSVCRLIGIEVVFFRGAERNRRRGFHNVFITYQRLHRELALLRREG
jgi:hypothetical protein